MLTKFTELVNLRKKYRFSDSQDSFIVSICLGFLLGGEGVVVFLMDLCPFLLVL